jgi:hypothetical protein
MYLVFGANEVVSIAGRLEEQALTGDFVDAVVTYELLRAAAARLITVMRSPRPDVEHLPSGTGG